MSRWTQQLPEDDAITELLQAGDGLGVFQVESSGMRDLLTKLRPSCLEDLVALVALFRRSLQAGMVDDFIDQSTGESRYLLPQLEPILDNTYGVVVYQEQVMRIAQKLAAIHWARPISPTCHGKKDMAEMDRQKARSWTARPATAWRKSAEFIFDLLAKFAAYGFNKSHSAAYGYISYQTAYLKAHHRGEYMAALMSIESNNTDKVLLYIGDCRRAGLEVLPPDINESSAAFDVPREHRNRIRFGLTAVKNVGAGAVESILQAREAQGGAFSSFMNCLESLDYSRVNKRVLENLVKCGAFDWTGSARAPIRGLEAAKRGAAASVGQSVRPGSLFGGMAALRAGFRLRRHPNGRLPSVWPSRKGGGVLLSGHRQKLFGRGGRFATCRITDVSAKGRQRNRNRGNAESDQGDSDAKATKWLL